MGLKDMQAQEIIIQAAESQDLPRLFEISCIVHATNYTELIPDDRKAAFFERYKPTNDRRNRYITFVQRKLNQTGYTLFKAIADDGVIVGYLAGEILHDETYEIRGLFVDPEYQGKGVGTKLVEEAIRKFSAIKMWLFVIEGNRAAIALYKKYGFEFTNYDIDKTFFGARLLHMSREVM